MPLEAPGFGGAPFQSQRGSIKSRLWTATIRRRRSRRCDLECRTSLGAFWGLRDRRWKVGHLGLAACPAKLLQGGWPTTQRAHASAAPDTKPDYDLHGGPACCVHIFINAKVTVSICVLVCTLSLVLRAVFRGTTSRAVCDWKVGQARSRSPFLCSGYREWTLVNALET